MIPFAAASKDIYGGPEGTQPVVNIFATSYIYSRQVANILGAGSVGNDEVCLLDSVKVLHRNN